MNTNFFHAASELCTTQHPFVSVMIIDAQGSTPQGKGARMIVSREGLYYGSVGGGKVESRAIEIAQNFLSSNDYVKVVDINLNKDLGMTCGGKVTLCFELCNKNRWDIAIFGAGHVAQSVINILKDLDCHINCFDPRDEWLNKLPQCPNVRKIKIDDWQTIPENIPPNSFIVIMTTGHANDETVVRHLFKSPTQHPFIGMIGTKSKAAFIRRNLNQDFTPEVIDSLTCPVGSKFGNNTPNEIAISIVSQLLEKRDLAN